MFSAVDVKEKGAKMSGASKVEATMADRAEASRQAHDFSACISP